MRPELLPRVTYCDPEIASIGLSEAEARQRHLKINVLRWPFAENDRAHTQADTAGLIKVVTTKNGRIVGAGIAGAGAGELIVPWALALSQKLRIADMAALIPPYPTRSEISRRVALTSFAESLRSPWLGRILRLMRCLG